MCPRSQRGFGVIAAIVILVIMAILATFILVLSNNQQHDAALDLDGARAYAAAMSGSEWGVARAAGPAPNCAFGAQNMGPINGMTVTVTGAVAAAGDALEAGLGTICLIRSTACNLPVGGACPGNTASPTYIERQIIALPER
jgi:MSHA biogenesis protein MshP